MMIRRSILFCVALLAFCGWVGHSNRAYAVDLASSAAPFVDRLAKEAIATLGDSSASKDRARKKVRELLHQGFDLKLIGRFVLGRYWLQATPVQQEEYQRLFENMVVQVYADRFSQYSGEQLQVSSTRMDGKDAFVVSQILRPNGPPVDVEWRVREINGVLKIIDVVVENVSMSVTQRSEFASVIQSKGGQVEGLLAAMREKNYANN